MTSRTPGDKTQSHIETDQATSVAESVQLGTALSYNATSLPLGKHRVEKHLQNSEAKLLQDILKNIHDLRRRVRKFSPPEWEKCFTTKGMDRRLDTLFQMFAKSKEKLELDFNHKPYFVDKNPFTKVVTINGQVPENVALQTDEEWLKEEKKKAEQSKMNIWFERFHDENCDATALIIYSIIVISIVISVITTIISTIEPWKDYKDTWFLIEMIVTICFSIEYAAKLLIVRRKVSYVLRIMNVFDLLAIIPFYFQITMDAEAFEDVGGVLRALRLTRIAKIRQLASPYTNIILQSTMDSVTGAGSSVVIFLFIASVITGTLVYAFENENDESGFGSIPIGMWYSIVTMTTVGYGDFYPMTTVGQFLGVFTILVGLVLVSLVVMVVGNYYIDRLHDYQTGKNNIKEEIFKVLAGCKRRQFQKTLKKTSPANIFKCIEVKLRMKEEKKMYSWWSKISGPGNNARTLHTFLGDRKYSLPSSPLPAVELAKLRARMEMDYQDTSDIDEDDTSFEFDTSSEAKRIPGQINTSEGSEGKRIPDFGRPWDSYIIVKTEQTPLKEINPDPPKNVGGSPVE